MLSVSDVKAVSEVGERGRAATRENKMPKRRKLVLECQPKPIALFVMGPEVEVGPIDDYREVQFEHPRLGWCRAVFFLLPDKNSDVRHAIQPMPIDAWRVPVRWDDPTMLFVPGLDDRFLLEAMQYLMENRFEKEVFEPLMRSDFD